MFGNDPEQEDRQDDFESFLLDPEKRPPVPYAPPSTALADFEAEPTPQEASDFDSWLSKTAAPARAELAPYETGLSPEAAILNAISGIGKGARAKAWNPWKAGEVAAARDRAAQDEVDSAYAQMQAGEDRELNNEYKRAQIERLRMPGVESPATALSREKFEEQKRQAAKKAALDEQAASLDSDITKRAQDIAILGLGPEASQADVAAIRSMTAADINAQVGGRAIMQRALREQSDARIAQRQRAAFTHGRQMADVSQTNALDRIDYEQGKRIEDESRREGKEIARAAQPVPGIVVDNDQAWTNAMRDPATANKVKQYAEDMNVMNVAAEKMNDMRQTYGAELPGSAASEFAMYKTMTIGQITKIAASGVLNGGEWDRYSKDIPGIAPSWEDLLLGRDIKDEQLQGVAKALRAMTDAKLRPVGGHYESPSEQAARESDNKIRRAPETEEAPPRVAVTRRVGPKVSDVVRAPQVSARGGVVDANGNTWTKDASGVFWYRDKAGRFFKIVGGKPVQVK